MNSIAATTRGARYLVRLIFSASLLTLAACGAAGGDTAVTTQSTVLSATQIATDLVKQKGLPGAVAVSVTTTSIDAQVSGVLRVGGATATINDRFAVGSLTKSMTASLAAVLVQEKRLTWESRPIDVLPEIAATAKAAYATVTLKDLLAHRSGVFAGVDTAQLLQVPSLTGDAVAQRAQFAQWALAQEPKFTPRSKTEYSNGGYVVAGAMLERVAGQAYEVAIQSRVFTPIGVRVVFGSPGADGASEAWGHTTANGRDWLASAPDSQDAYFPAVLNPAGGAKLSAVDFGKYLQMHLRALRGRADQPISAASAVLLHTIVQEGLALGWIGGKDTQDRPLTFHNGSNDASYYALMAVYDARDGAGVVITNAYRASVASDLNTALLGLLP